MSSEKTLNTLLDQLDSRLGKLEANTGHQAESILHNLDEIYDLFETRKDQERLLSVERDQFEYLQNRLRKAAGPALHELGGPSVLLALRADCHPERARWWWFLDEEISAQRRKSLKGKSLVITIILAVIAVVALVYQFFLAPDPAVVAAIRYQNDAYLSLSDGNLPKALDSIDQALASQPDDPDVIIFKAILLQKLGQDQQQVDELNAQAEKILGGRDKFLLSRSMLDLQTSDFASALADAQASLAINPNSAVAHYYSGTAYENMGDPGKALQEYDTAYNLADKQGQTELAATIKIASAMLQQASQGVYMMESTATP